MMSAEDCARRAFQALVRGDYAERDRWLTLAENIILFGQRVEHDMPPLATEGIELKGGEPQPEVPKSSFVSDKLT